MNVLFLITTIICLVLLVLVIVDYCVGISRGYKEDEERYTHYWEDKEKKDDL